MAWVDGLGFERLRVKLVGLESERLWDLEAVVVGGSKLCR
jgi:hypothetical protein